MDPGNLGEIIQRFAVNRAQLWLLRETASIFGQDNLWWCKYYLVQRMLKSQGFGNVWSSDIVMISPANAERHWSKYHAACNINSDLVIHARLQILNHPHICFKRQMSTGACFLVFGQLATGRGWLGNRRQEEERKMKENWGGCRRARRRVNTVSWQRWIKHSPCVARFQDTAEI